MGTLIAAYVFAWAAVLAYLAFQARTQSRLDRRLEVLEDQARTLAPEALAGRDAA